jgi:hypothetical protein
MKLNDIIELAKDNIVLTRPSEIVKPPVRIVREVKEPVKTRGVPQELSAEL